MMNEKHMPKSYWAKAAHMAVYLMNRCTTVMINYIKLMGFTRFITYFFFYLFITSLISYSSFS